MGNTSQFSQFILNILYLSYQHQPLDIPSSLILITPSTSRACKEHSNWRNSHKSAVWPPRSMVQIPALGDPCRDKKEKQASHCTVTVRLAFPPLGPVFAARRCNLSESFRPVQQGAEEALAYVVFFFFFWLD